MSGSCSPCLILQASVNKGSIRLADNGARLAGRLAQMHEDISRQHELVQMFAEQLAADTEAGASANGNAPPSRGKSHWQQGQAVLSPPKSSPATANGHHAQHADHTIHSRLNPSSTTSDEHYRTARHTAAEQRRDAKGQQAKPFSGSQSRHGQREKREPKGRFETSRRQDQSVSHAGKGQKSSVLDQRYYCLTTTFDMPYSNTCA